MLEDCKKEFDEVHKDMVWMERQLKTLEVLSTLAVVVVLGLLMYIAIF